MQKKRALYFYKNYFAFSPFNFETATITAALFMSQLMLGYENNMSFYPMPA
jgi:hypothetical protein